MSHPSLVVETTNLSHSYGRHRVLHDVDLQVERGRIYGLIGPNGAGKSTLLGSLLGLVRPQQGSIRLFGLPWERELLVDVGASINGPAFHPHLSARENLRIHALLRGIGQSRVAEVLEDLGLADVGRAPAGSFSTGMKGRLALAMALLGAPDLLVLDEPQNGLDPEGIRQLRARLRAHADAGHSVIVSSHLLDEVAHVADDIGVLVDGTLRYQGPLAGLAAGGSLEDAFFELTAAAA